MGPEMKFHFDVKKKLCLHRFSLLVNSNEIHFCFDLLIYYLCFVKYPRAHMFSFEWFHFGAEFEISFLSK